MAEVPATAGPFRHVGFFYRTAKEYATTVAAFLRIIPRVQAFAGADAETPCPYNTARLGQARP